jgi:glycosyltransferase involved in cell wall biosynthesis
LRNRGLKHIHTAYGTIETHKLEEIRNSNRQFIKNLLESADQVIAVSHFVRKVLRTHLGIDSKVIYNGVDTEFFKPERGSKKVLERYKLDKPLVLYVGRLIGKKRPDLVLEMAEKFKEATFAIRGDGRFLREKIPNNVKFLPFLREIELAELFATSDIFLFPSEHEPFGLVTIEAMSSGTPVIGHNSGGTKEIVKDGETGFLTDNTTSDLSEKLSKLLEDENLRRKMGEKARERVKNKFSLHRMVREYSDLYESMIAG